MRPAGRGDGGSSGACTRVRECVCVCVRGVGWRASARARAVAHWRNAPGAAARLPRASPGGESSHQPLRPPAAHLEAELAGLDRGHVAAGAAAHNNDVILCTGRARREEGGEGREARVVGRDRCVWCRGAGAREPPCARRLETHRQPPRTSCGSWSRRAPPAMPRTVGDDGRLALTRGARGGCACRSRAQTAGGRGASRATTQRGGRRTAAAGRETARSMSKSVGLRRHSPLRRHSARALRFSRDAPRIGSPMRDVPFAAPPTLAHRLS